MTTPADDEGRLLLIKKLLNKAEAKGTTPEERDAFSAKATKLILQWGIDVALLADADRTKKEQVTQRIVVADAPKTYSYEYAVIVVRVAEGLGCRGILTKVHNGQTGVIIVGFVSDVERSVLLAQSLVLQCTLDGAAWYAKWLSQFPSWIKPTGSDKYNARRGFISGFGTGVREKMAAWKRDTLTSAAPGTDLVLVDRKKQVDAYVRNEMQVTMGNSRRRYTGDSRSAGKSAGLAADLGQGGVGQNSGRPAVGR